MFFIRGLPVLCFLFPLTCLEKHFVKLQYKKCLPTLTLAEKKANLLHVILHVSLCISVIMCVGGLAVSWHHVNSISIICIWSFLLAIFCFFYISTIFLYACTPHHPHLCESVSACVYVCVCVCVCVCRCVHVTMINEFRRVPVGWDQVQQDLT